MIEAKEAHLVRLKVNGFQRIEAAELAFDGSGFVEVTGRNRAGKSALIRSIWTAFGGKKVSRPIKDGEDEAQIELEADLDGRKLIIRRKWKRRDNGDLAETLKVLLDDTNVSKPQAFLSSLLSEISFDPMAWCNLGRGNPEMRRKQAQELAKGLGLKLPASVSTIATKAGQSPLPVDADDPIGILNLLDSAIRDQRKRANGDAEREEAKAEALSEFEAVRKPDIASIQVKLTENAATAQRRATADEQVRSAGDLVGEAQRQIAHLKERLAGWHDSLGEREVSLAAATDAVGLCPTSGLIGDEARELQGELADAGAKDVQFRKWRERVALEESAKGLHENWQVLDDAVKAVLAAREEMLAGADLPSGLTFDPAGDGLLFHGRPFPASASSEETITVSIAVAAATHPTLKLLRIEDGDRLDAEHFAALDRELKARGMTALVEIVDESAERGIVISDGRVVKDLRESHA